MGLYLLFGGTFIAIFMAGPPLIMAYAAYKERRASRSGAEIPPKGNERSESGELQ